jgi:glycosyltransferase involved in cell wall biosynthesis
MKSILLINEFPFEPLLKFFKENHIHVEIYQSKLKNLRYKSLSLLRYPFYQLWDVIRFYRFCKKKKFDAIHVNFAYSGILPLILGKTYYLECHGSDVRRNLKLPLIGWMTKLAIKKAKKVFYATPDLYQYIHKIRSDAIYIPDPVDTKLFSPYKKIKRTKGEVIKILVCTKLTNAKGGKKIIALVKKLSNLNKKIIFTIFKLAYVPNDFAKISDIDHKYLAVQSHELNKDYIKLINPVAHTAFVNLIQDHDLVIGQFAIGSLGVSELESLSCEKIVVTYVNRSYYRENPPPIIWSKSTNSLTNHILKIINNPSNFREISKKSREWILKTHDSNVIGKKLLKLYGLDNRK